MLSRCNVKHMYTNRMQCALCIYSNIFGVWYLKFSIKL